MTAAKAVETSVSSTNSLSQDYTNLDDQLPQTCHDSPRFKPFTVKNLFTNIPLNETINIAINTIFKQS